MVVSASAPAFQRLSVSARHGGLSEHSGSALPPFRVAWSSARHCAGAFPQPLGRTREGARPRVQRPHARHHVPRHRDVKLAAAQVEPLVRQGIGVLSAQRGQVDDRMLLRGRRAGMCLSGSAPAWSMQAAGCPRWCRSPATRFSVAPQRRSSAAPLPRPAGAPLQRARPRRAPLPCPPGWRST